MKTNKQPNKQPRTLTDQDRQNLLAMFNLLVPTGVLGSPEEAVKFFPFLERAMEPAYNDPAPSGETAAIINAKAPNFSRLHQYGGELSNLADIFENITANAISQGLPPTKAYQLLLDAAKKNKTVGVDAETGVIKTGAVFTKISELLLDAYKEHDAANAALADAAKAREYQNLPYWKKLVELGIQPLGPGARYQAPNAAEQSAMLNSIIKVQGGQLEPTYADKYPHSPQYWFDAMYQASPTMVPRPATFQPPGSVGYHPADSRKLNSGFVPPGIKSNPQYWYDDSSGNTIKPPGSTGYRPKWNDTSDTAIFLANQILKNKAQSVMDKRLAAQERDFQALSKVARHKEEERLKQAVVDFVARGLSTWDGK